MRRWGKGSCFVTIFTRKLIYIDCQAGQYLCCRILKREYNAYGDSEEKSNLVDHNLRSHHVLAKYSSHGISDLTWNEEKEKKGWRDQRSQRQASLAEATVFQKTDRSIGKCTLPPTTTPKKPQPPAHHAPTIPSTTTTPHPPLPPPTPTLHEMEQPPPSPAVPLPPLAQGSPTA